MRLMGGGRGEGAAAPVDVALVPGAASAFAAEERYMISGVLTLASRSLRTIMTPRNEISWIDCRQPADEIRRQLMETPHSLFPVCEGSLDQLLGVVRAKDLLMALKQNTPLAEFAAQHTPIVVLESPDVINVLDVLRQAKGRLVMVSDEFGVVQGLVTPLDVLEAIAGEFPDEDEALDIVGNEQGWLVKGSTDLHTPSRRWTFTDWCWAVVRSMPRWPGFCWRILTGCRRWGRR